MTDAALDLVTGYGWIVLFAATYFSCLCVPVPSSFVMLAGGAFASTGDLAMVEVLLAPFLGAVLGDNTGFLLGKHAGKRLTKLRESRLGQRALAYLTGKGSIAVFLSTWLFSPLGPYVNFVAGGTGMAWRRFLIADTLGEATWVGIYVGLGFLFVEYISLIADVLGSILGLLTAALIAGFLFREIWKVARNNGKKTKTDASDS